MSENNTNETKVNTKSVNSRLFKAKYGNNSTPNRWSSDFISKGLSLKTRIWKMSQNGSPCQNQSATNRIHKYIRMSSKAGRTHNFFSAYFNIHKRVFYSVHQVYNDQISLNRKTDFWLSNASKVS